MFGGLIFSKVLNMLGIFYFGMIIVFYGILWYIVVFVIDIDDKILMGSF